MQSKQSPSGTVVSPESGRPRGCFRWVWRILLVLVLILAGLVVLGFMYQVVASEQDKQKHPPPGQLVDVGGYKLHIYCMGESREGRPTVILDSQNGGTVSSWVWIQPEIAKVTRACAYDRAGLGWSDLGPEAQDTRQNAQALHTLLNKAGIEGPYVLVGHSFGGLYVRMYANQYPDEVAGMVLIEGTNPDTFKALGQPDIMPGPPEAMINIGPIVSRLGILRLAKFITADTDLPEQQRGEMQGYYDSDKFAELIRRQYQMFPTLLAEIRGLDGLGEKPLAVVLGNKGDGGNEKLRELFDQQAALSTNSSTVIVEGATHIGLVDNHDHAQQTKEAILNVVNASTP